MTKYGAVMGGANNHDQIVLFSGRGPNGMPHPRSTTSAIHGGWSHCMEDNLLHHSYSPSIMWCIHLYIYHYIGNNIYHFVDNK